MNYKKLYETFISYCNKIQLEERLKKRNINDTRIGKKYIYIETHHIIPRSQGGSNDRSNLVDLLPEEHIFAHQLRWKAYKNRNDMLAVRFCLNGITGEKCSQVSEIINHTRLTKSIRSTYMWMKQNSAEVRKTHGWHTQNGTNRISKARKGKMPVKDLEGNMIGSVSINHPKVLSGEWVHHAKGRVLSEEEKKGKACPGEKNGRYSGITDEQIIDIACEYSKQLGRIPCISHIRKFAKEKYDIDIPKFFSKFRFPDKKWYEHAKEKTGLDYNPYYRSDEMKKQISETLRNKGKQC